MSKLTEQDKKLRHERLDHANTLIKLIGNHGRRFFWDAQLNRYGRFEISGGHLYYRDEYSDKVTYMHNTGFRNTWECFTHGGTLKALVQDMADYILTGKKVAAWKIVIERRNSVDFDDNIWGYPVVQARKLRRLAVELPIIEATSVLKPLLD